MKQRRRRRLGDALVDERIVKPKGGASCPVFRVGIRRHGTTIHADVSAEAGPIGAKATDSLGYVMAKPNHDDGSLDVWHAWATKPSCGVGTRLYEALAREACSRNLRLRSDLILSRFSLGFWKKQESRGRAVFDETAKRFVLGKCELTLDRTKGRRRR